MKKIFSILIVILIPLFSCTKTEVEEVIKIKTDTIYIEKSDVEYYVKYHYYGDGGYHYCNFSIKYLNSVTSNSNPAENTITYTYPNTKSQHIENEIICGPFKKNDKVSIEMYNESSVSSRLLEIYVSKENSPFALRKNTNSSKLEYTIDY